MTRLILVFAAGLVVAGGISVARGLSVEESRVAFFVVGFGLLTGSLGLALFAGLTLRFLTAVCPAIGSGRAYI